MTIPILTLLYKMIMIIFACMLYVCFIIYYLHLEKQLKRWLVCWYDDWYAGPRGRQGTSVCIISPTLISPWSPDSWSVTQLTQRIKMKNPDPGPGLGPTYSGRRVHWNMTTLRDSDTKHNEAILHSYILTLIVPSLIVMAVTGGIPHNCPEFPPKPG